MANALRVHGEITGTSLNNIKKFILTFVNLIPLESKLFIYGSGTVEFALNMSV